MVSHNSELSAIYNNGERLVPGETHDRDEVIRHKSSYEFFYRVIESDICKNPSILSRGLRILDIGSGTGHGTFMLSRLPGVKVTGLEPGRETVDYARQNYSAANLEYINTDLESYIKSCGQFDYVVSRHALEHVLEGLDMALAIPVVLRLMVNVPFNEDDRNPYHLVHWIDEQNFTKYKNKEFFYESLDGETSLTRSVDSPPNSIICVSSADGLEKVEGMFPFPLPAWRPDFLQERGLFSIGLNLPKQEAQLLAREADLELRETVLTNRIAENEEAIKGREQEIANREQEIANREQMLEARIAAFDSSKSVKVLRTLGLLR